MIIMSVDSHSAESQQTVGHCYKLGPKIIEGHEVLLNK